MSETKETLLDVNVLLALAWPNHQHHAVAHDWFRRQGRRRWATCALTELAFVRLSSNPAYTSAAVSPSAAAALLAQFTAHRAHRYWGELAAPGEGVFTRAMGHQQVMDAYLVSEAERRAGSLATLDRRTVTHATNPATVVLLA